MIGQMTRQRVMYGLTLIIGGMCLLLFLSPVGARGEQAPPAGCPPLPEQGPADQVSVYVTKAPDVPGVVCARVINGFSSNISSGPPNLKLQQWEAGGWWQKGKFRDFRETESGSVSAIVTANIVGMPPGVIVDRRLPLSGQPAPTGKYRACFNYIPPGKGEYQQACSEEFSLP